MIGFTEARGIWEARGVMSTGGAAMLLGVTRRAVFEWCRAGLLPTLPRACEHGQLRIPIEAIKDVLMREGLDMERIVYLTTGEVAKMLGVQPKTVSRWAKEGRLPFLKTLGGHRRYSKVAIEQLAKELWVDVET